MLTEIRIVCLTVSALFLAFIAWEDWKTTFIDDRDTKRIKLTNLLGCLAILIGDANYFPLLFWLVVPFAIEKLLRAFKRIPDGDILLLSAVMSIYAPFFMANEQSIAFVRFLVYLPAVSLIYYVLARTIIGNRTVEMRILDLQDYDTIAEDVKLTEQKLLKAGFRKIPKEMLDLSKKDQTKTVRVLIGVPYAPAIVLTVLLSFVL